MVTSVAKDGEIVKSTDKANELFTIPYYQVKGEGVVTTNAADKTKYDGVNDVTVTYTYERIKKAVKIEKYDQATGLKIDGADQTTTALAAGETHNVTLTDVAGYTSLDSSISIFVDGTDNQTVKAYYKQSDEVFITVKQMCGGVLLNSYKVPAQYGVKQEIKAGLEGLAGQIPGLVDIQVNIHGLASSNADLMLDSSFETGEAISS